MKRFTQMVRNEEGSIAILAAVGILLIMGVLALSVDHGRNYMHQSDVEAKLSALTKVAGNEYINWTIRRKINDAAILAGLPGVTNPTSDSDPMCKTYILCYLDHPQAGFPADPGFATYDRNDPTKPGPVATLKYFVEQQINLQLGNDYPCTMGPKCVTVQTPELKLNASGSARYLEFKTQRAMENGTFGVLPASVAPQESVSGVLINSFNNRAIASQIVYSLDMDSKNQLGGGTDYVSQVFTLLQAASSGDSLITSKLKIGLTIGNVAVEGPSGAGGFNCSNGGGIGGSGGCHDNQQQFSGTDITTTPVKIQGRKYSFKGEFIATDALLCSNPVWTYRSVGTSVCNEPAVMVGGDVDPGNSGPPSCAPSGGGGGGGTLPKDPPEYDPDPGPGVPDPPCNTSCGGVDSWAHTFD